MNARRVAVTGIGIISALGCNVTETWRSLREGESGIRHMPLLEAMGLKFQNGAEVRDYDPVRHFNKKRIDWLDRYAQLALVAAGEALTDSGLKITPEAAEKMAVIT